MQPCWLYYNRIRWSEFSIEPGWSRRLDQIRPAVPSNPTCCDTQICVLRNPHQIHEAEGNLASAALPGNAGQSNVPSYLSTVLVSVLPSLIWVATLRERSYSKCDLPCQPVVNPSQVTASSKGKAGVFTRHFPAVPQELCQGRAECSTSAHRTPTSAQKSSLELLEGHNPTCV